MGRSGRVAIIGAGPAGLFLARMIGVTQPGTTVEVYERTGPDDSFGFGVTISDRTMQGVSRHDPRTHQRIAEASVALSGIELRLPDATLRYGGFRVRAISRHTLLAILQEQAEDAGAVLRFRHEVTAADLGADIVAIADGANSGNRTVRRAAFGTSIQTGSARYIWLGSSADFGDATVFAFVRTEYGPIAAHSYPYGAGMSTVVVETDDATWRNAGLDSAGEIDEDALALLSGAFADHLGGHPLVTNRSRWSRFGVVRNACWSSGNLVLLGDAAHTAHFTVGSGTKLALEDSIALASALPEHDDRGAAFAAYERQRRGPVTRTQRLAEPSMRWWETYGRRLHMPPAQFGMHFLTRTVAISYLGLRRRCGDRVDDAEAAYHRAAGTDPGRWSRNAVAAPFQLGEVRLANRLVSVLPAVPGSPPPVPLLAAGLVLLSDGIPVPARRPECVLGTLQPAGWEPPEHPAGFAAPQFADLHCPDGPERVAAADELVRWAGVLRKHGAAGVLLRAGAASTWDDTLRYASRIRTEAGMAVAVCVPADWALDLTREAEVDAWPTRIHVGLVSGRIDLVAVGAG